MAGSGTEGPRQDARGMRIGIVASRYHAELVERLIAGAVDWLRAHGADDEDLTVMRVPGSFEIPLAARRLAEGRKVDAVICLGVLLRGETLHFDLVASEAARGVSETARDTGVPCSFGVIAALERSHAEARCGGSLGNRGDEAARSAVEMVHELRQLAQDADPAAGA